MQVKRYSMRRNQNLTIRKEDRLGLVNPLKYSYLSRCRVAYEKRMFGYIGEAKVLIFFSTIL